MPQKPGGRASFRPPTPASHCINLVAPSPAVGMRFGWGGVAGRLERSLAGAGKTFDSLERLDALGWIRELATDGLREAVAAEYLAARTRKENVLMVVQTREEVCAINEVIRQGLAVAGSLRPGKTLTAMEALDWTEAKKCDARYYQSGQRVQFLRRYARFRARDSREQG